MCIAFRPPSAILSSSMSSEVACAAMMPSRAAALMATTFMTVSQCRRLRRFVNEIVSQGRFRDVCTKGGKWFRGRENCFVEPPATKQSGRKSQQFEGDEFQAANRPSSRRFQEQKPPCRVLDGSARRMQSCRLCPELPVRRAPVFREQKPVKAPRRGGQALSPTGANR